MPRAKLRTDRLRDDVLAAAMELVEGDRTALTARAVAGAAQTSTAAVYELFGDKAGVLRAVFYEAFRRLHDELSAVPTTDDPRADLVSLLAATREFALAHPMWFEVMFARPFAQLVPDPNDSDAAAGIIRLVMDVVDRALTAEVLVGDRRDIAHVVIAVNRGLIASELTGVAGSTAANIDRRWRLGIDAVLDGFGPGS